jgi:hypothetical protein
MVRGQGLYFRAAGFLPSSRADVLRVPAPEINKALSHGSWAFRPVHLRVNVGVNLAVAVGVD